MSTVSVTPQLQPRGSIEILDVHGRVVPLLDWGPYIQPSSARDSRYRESWSEEEDLLFTFRHSLWSPDGSGPQTVEYTGSVHGNFGYELIVREKTQSALLRVDYFIVSPLVVNGKLSLDYEPKSVLFSGSLKRGSGLRVQLELQEGFSADQGEPLFKWLAVRCD